MSDRCIMLLLACALVTLTGIVIGAAAGYLARRDRASYPEAMTRASVAFAATPTLVATPATAIAGVARG